MDFKYYAEKLWYKIIYLIFVIGYLILLNYLNHELLSINFESPFKLLAYNNYVALKYFVIGFVLFVIGCLLLYREGKSLTRGLEDFREIIVTIVTMVVILTLLIFIIIFINNPILRAVLFSVLIILGTAVAVTN